MNRRLNIRRKIADYVYINGVTIEKLELTYSPKELVKTYTDYNTERKLSFEPFFKEVTLKRV